MSWGVCLSIRRLLEEVDSLQWFSFHQRRRRGIKYVLYTAFAFAYRFDLLKVILAGTGFLPYVRSCVHGLRGYRV